MKKIIAIALLAVMAVSMLVSCNNTNTPSNTQDAVTQVIEGEGGDKLVIDETKLDGYEYNILVAGNIDYKHGSQHFGNDYYYDEEATDVLNQAKHDWIADAEQKFDITIVAIDKSKFGNCKGSGNGFNELNRANQSGDTPYDSCMIGAYDVCTAARNGYLADLNNVDYINLSNSWWDQVANKDLNIQGKMYYTTGDISIVDNVFTHCVFFNKDMIKALNMESPYELVDNNEWTLDKFIELVKKGSDTSGEGVSEESKVYGLLTWNDSMLQIMAAADERIASVDENGDLQFTMYNDRTQTLYDKFTSLALDSSYSVNYQVLQASGWDELRKGIFDSNRAVFYLNLLSTTTHHRDSTTDFGILPYPKLEATQENYGHLVSSFHTYFFCVPKLHYSSAITGSVSEYMAYTGKTTTKVAYYDSTLKGKHIRDEESGDMLDIIFASRVYDVGTYYKVGSITDKLGGLYKNTTTTFQQIYNDNKELAETIIKGINNGFLADEE